MAAHTLLLEFLLLISACLQFSQISAQRTRDDLPYHVQPTGYVLKLLPLPQDELFIGNIKISILCVSKTSTIVLHADKDLFIPRGGIVVREPRDASNNIHIQIPVANITRNTQMNQLTIALNQELEEWATYEVKLHFSGKLTTADDWGFFRSRYIDRVTGEEKWYVGTKLKPGMARKVFPCFDGTEYKATFSISVGRHNATNATVLSSMKRKSITHMKTADGWVWENFHHTPRMLPSSIGIAMFELEEVVSGSAPTVDIRIYGNKVLSSQLETLLKDFMKLMVFMEHYLDRTLPLRKIDLVVLPDFVLDAHVNSWGLILMSDYLLPNDWTALHGLLDLWFRHFSTPENEDSPLCNALHKFFFWQSGLVPWMPADHLDGLLGDDSSPKMNSEHYESFLRMLNYSVSSETVRLGLQSFVGDRQAFATYSDTVLWYFLTASGHHQNTLDMSMAVKDIAYSWVGLDYATVDDVEVDDSNVFSWTKIDQEHILIEGTTRMDRMPIVTVSRNYQNNTATVEQHVFVKQRLNKKHISSFWWIPIMYLTPNSLDPSLIQPKTWMRGENEVTITRLPSENDFIIVNPEYAGMFVVNYDKHNWRLLVDYLQSNQFQKIPELTRSKLLYDSWNLAYFGELDMVTALNMSQYLSQETSEAVWRPFLVLFNEFLEYMSDTAAETLLEGYMLNQLLGARTSGADWITDNMLCRYGYEDCIYYLKGAYNMWTAHNNLEYKLTYDQFCYTFKYGTMEEYEFGLDFLLTHEIKDKWNYSNMFFLLQTLALCPVDSKKVERYLNAIFVEKNSNILDVDIMSILIRFRNHAQGRWMTVLDFVSKNFAAVKNRLKKVPHVWNLLVSEVTRHFITQEGLNEIGIIGGTGLDDPDILENRKETTVTTPFGDPSDVLIEGQISGVDCFVGKELKTA